MKYSHYSGLFVWYALWFYALWPFHDIDLSIGGLVGGFWWIWLPILILVAIEKRMKKKIGM